ncbi:MAG: cytochrome P450 [Dehalococcoidia bacterium]|nr:cytochrome P450 [Dehalococcoidia bacterium]
MTAQRRPTTQQHVPSPPRRVPRDHWPDATLALVRTGYPFIQRRCRSFGSDVFSTRLLLQPAICLTGADAARLFYDRELFQRAGAAPARMTRTLTGAGGVQGLDGARHAARKAMLLSLMTPARIDALAEATARLWESCGERWQRAEAIVLLDEARLLLARAVCDWAGVPLPAADAAARTGDLGELIESGAALGLRHWRGVLARRRAERWAGAAIAAARDGRLQPAADQALAVIARHREPDGRPLDERVAAIDLLNILRPTVAVARFITDAALALHTHPRCRDELRRSDDDVRCFVQEVRRYYPFFPFVVARVRRDFVWRGYRFPQRTRVLLDLYGTNRDPRSWQHPDEFQPRRFRDWPGDPFTFIPQGGDGFEEGHRCAGEWLTIALMEIAVRALTSTLTYDVPPQDLRVDLRRIPAGPASGFIMRRVRVRQAGE